MRGENMREVRRKSLGKREISEKEGEGDGRRVGREGK